MRTKRRLALFLLSVKTLHLERFCFPFAAHCPQFSLTRSTTDYWCKRTFTSSVFCLTRLSLILNHTIHKLRLPSNFMFSRSFSLEERMKLGQLQLPKIAATSTSCKQLHQHQKCEVKKETLSCFKKEWMKILMNCGVGEPFWSVKWIVEHVLRKHPKSSEVCL